MADNAQKASGSSARDIRHGEIWSLLEEYADIRDELEETFDSFRYLQSEIEIAMEDITDELENLQRHLDTCSVRLMRFRTPRNKPHGTIEASREFLVDG